MKRASILGALALVAGFFLAAPAAQAQVTCTTVPPGNASAYPWNVGAAKKCGTAATGDGTAIALTIYQWDTLAHNAYTKLAAHPLTVKYYVFGTPAEYDSYMTSIGAPHTPASAMTPFLFGETVKDSTGRPIFSAVWTRDVTGLSINSFADVSFAMAHELGHHTGYFYLSLVGTRIPSTPIDASSSYMYNEIMNRDIAILNNTVVTKQCGTGGIFNGRQDWRLSPSQPWICSGTQHNVMPLLAPYGGSNSWDVLFGPFGLSLWGDSFKSHEIWANQVAKLTGHDDDAPRGVIVYTNRFVCTNRLVKELIKEGRLPTVSEMAAVKLPGSTSTAACPSSGTGWSLPLIH